MKKEFDIIKWIRIILFILFVLSLTIIGLFFNGITGKVTQNFESQNENNCIVDGYLRKNGESWCSYDNIIGNGKDTVGSRHIKHICTNGIEKLEPCSDYRDEVCFEEIISNNLLNADCRKNYWKECLNINLNNDSTQLINQCNNNLDCFVKHIDMGGSFKFDVCVPQYPPGFNLENESDDLSITDISDAICSIGTQRCTETWVCSLIGCFCVDNCKCSTKYFLEQMNQLCISLGDCGAYVNYINISNFNGYNIKSTHELKIRLNELDILKLKENDKRNPLKINNIDLNLEYNSDQNIINYPLYASKIGYKITNNILSNHLNSIKSYFLVSPWITYRYVDFTCSKWQRPNGGENCNKCNDPFTPCTEYRCQSLGKSCKLIDQKCTDSSNVINKNVVSIEPSISAISYGYKYFNSSDVGFDIKKESGSCLDFNETVSIGIKVDPFAKCRFDTDATKKWEDMTYEFGFKGDDILPIHQMNLSYQNNSDYRIFVKCKTADESENIKNFTINICYRAIESNISIINTENNLNNNNESFGINPNHSINISNESLYNSNLQLDHILSNIVYNQTSLSEYSIETPNNAIDKNKSTMWNAGSWPGGYPNDNANLTINLNQTYIVKNYTIFCAGSYGGNIGNIYFYNSNNKLIAIRNYSNCNYETMDYGISGYFNIPLSVKKVIIAGKQARDNVNIVEFEMYGYSP